MKRSSPLHALVLAAALLAAPAATATAAAEENDDRPHELDAKIPRADASDRDALRALLGQRAVVTGTVTSARDWDGGINFLNFPGGHFVAVTFTRHYDRFPDRPANLYQGKQIELIGILEEYKGQVQIRLEKPAQILSAKDPGPAADDENTERDEGGDADSDNPGPPSEVDPADYFDAE